MKRLLILSSLIILIIALTARALLHSKGLTVTSWWRSPWKNYEVGGKWLSLHLIGWGFDVIPVNKSLHDVLAIWPFKFVVESDHIHLQIL
jgi:hypothetical protein